MEDAAFINNGIASRKLFRFITDLAVQEKIRLNVLSTKGLILILWSYSESTKYLEPLVNAIKILVEVGLKETLCWAFYNKYICSKTERGSYL
jgi:Protein of unknown function (DUF3723)